MDAAITINPGSELSRQLKEAAAEKKPVRLTSGDTTYVVQVQSYEINTDTGQHHNPAQIRWGLARSSGALKGIDLIALKKELHKAREQDSAGGPRN